MKILRPGKKYRWDAALARIPKNQKVRIAEIGVWCGDFSEQILRRRPKVRIIQVDRWTIYSDTERVVETDARMSRYEQRVFDKAKAENFAKIAPYINRVKIIESDSVAAAEQVKDGSLFLTFIDASHSEVGCGADIDAWLPKIMKGGWLGGHDYPRRKGVKAAVNKRFGNKVIPGPDATWWVKV